MTGSGDGAVTAGGSAGRRGRAAAPFAGSAAVGENAAMATAARTRSRWGDLFAVVAFAEAFTWAGLLVGMLLKHVTRTTDAGVAVFGALHGVMFLVYLVVAVVCAWRLRWSIRVTLLALAAAVPPLTTLVFEIWARRRGLLASR
jgi:integral membrane protein